MSVLLAEATVRVTTDVSQIGAQAEAGVRRQAGAFSGIGGIVGGILGASLVQAGVEGIKHLFDAGLTEAKESTETQAQFAAGIKSTGNAANLSIIGMKELASSVAAYSGQSTASIGKTEQVLQTFTNLKNVGPDKIFDDATVAAANMAAKMGGDASENAVRLGRALSDPEHGVMALTRVGVVFTDQQKEQIKTLQESGDTLGAQKIILGELSKEFGDAAEAAGQTWPGALNRGRDSLRVMAGDLLNAFGPTALRLLNAFDGTLGKLMPIVETIAEDVSAKLAKVDFSGLLNTVLPLAGAFSPLHLVFEALKPSIPVVVRLVGQLAGILGGVFKAVLPIVASLLGEVAKVLAKILPAVTPIISVVGGALMEIFKALAPVIPPVISVVLELFKALEPLIPPILQIVEAFLPLVSVLGDLIAQILPPVISLLMAILKPILALISPLVDLLVPALKIVGKVVTIEVGIMGDVFKNVFGAIGAVIGWLVDYFTTSWNNVTTGLGIIGKAFSNTFNAIGGFISSAFTGAAGIVKGAINGIIGVVNGAIGAIDKLKVSIPSWVPLIGGTTLGFSIPKIPLLARGSGNAPDSFIAGENGPELVTGARGSRVSNTAETRDLLASSSGGRRYYFAPGSITVNAKDVKELSDLLDMLDALPQVARSGPGTGKAA